MAVVQLNSRASGRGTNSDRKGVVAALDIGSSKISCLIAETQASRHRLAGGGEGPNFRILGFGHHLARGVKGGAIVDIDEAERAIRVVVDAAERMAQRTITEVYVNVSGGRPLSECFKAKRTTATGLVSPRDIDEVIATAMVQIKPRRRSVLHISPIQFHLDSASGISSPLGMHGTELGLDLGVMSVETAYLKNLSLAIERSHLAVKGYMIASYAAGKAILTDDERQLGSIVIDLGGGTTSIAIFHGGSLIFADSVPIGGMHVTHDIAQGLSTTVAHAERMKTLWGGTISANADEHEMIAVPLMGERGVDTVSQVPRSVLTSIIRPRIDEIMEHVCAKLDACGYAQLAGQRVVLSGGASQLGGLRDTVQHWLQRHVRLASLSHCPGMPEVARSPGFAVSFGLLNYALRPDKAWAIPAQVAANLEEAQYGYVRRVGRWLADSF